VIGRFLFILVSEATGPKGIVGVSGIILPKVIHTDGPIAVSELSHNRRDDEL
jgi:hypothetical protein